MAVSNRINFLKSMVGSALIYVGLIFTPAKVAACDAPQYRKAVVYENSQSSTLMQISITLNDFAPKRLKCLVQALKRTYAGRKTIGVSIFSSYRAAKYYRIVTGDVVDGRVHDWGRELHAEYFYDAAKHIEYLKILPLGDHSPFATNIDMSSNSIPLCRLQISGRCLLSANPLEYPRSAATSELSGTIAMTGIIAADGKVKVTRVAQTSPDNMKGRGLLENAAVNNLKSWRFEPAARRQVFRITYVFEVGPPGSKTLEFSLPDKVIIRPKR